MLLSVYMKPVWKIFSCRFHSFRLLNRHEWLGAVWSRTTEPCKHELIWDRSESVRDHCFEHAQECCWTIPRWRITGKRLKKIRLVGSLKRGMFVRRGNGLILSFFFAFNCILISSAAFNNKRHNEADHERKIGTSCMFHVHIYADLKSRTGLM